MGVLPSLPIYQPDVGEQPLALFLADLRSWVFRSQARAAAFFGCDRTTIWRYEEGRSLPQPGYVAALALLIVDRFQQETPDARAAAAEQLLAALNQALLVGYPGVPPFASWEQLAEVAHTFRLALRPATVHWGDAPEVLTFFGRQADLAALQQLVVTEQRRVVTLLGVGGVGKTILAARLVALVAHQFSQVIWRSLLNAPPLERVLQDWLHLLAAPHVAPAQPVDLLGHLQSRRCLLVLDNVESLLAGGAAALRYRPGYEDYGRLLRLLAEAPHQSCLLLTSRELPHEVQVLTQTIQTNQRVAVYRLGGLAPAEARQLLASMAVAADDPALPTLVERCTGNPKILQIVAANIRQFYAGSLSRFLAQEGILFGEVRDIMQQHYARLGEAQREVLHWLALNREPLSLAELREMLLTQASRDHLLETLAALQACALLEGAADGFFLQNAVTEFVVEVFLATIDDELQTGRFVWLHRHALLRTNAQDYVRASQVRVLLAPLAQRLLHALGQPATDALLAQRVAEARQAYADRPSYLGGNLLNLLVHLGVALDGWDFSRLALWQVYLQGVNLRHASFAHCDLRDAMFSTTFGSVRSVALSPDGRLLAAGASNGEVHLWRLRDRSHLLTLDGGCWIEAVGFSPTSQALLSAGIDGVIRWWDVHTGALQRQLLGHSGGIRSLAFSPDGMTLASGSEDATIRLWDVASGQCRHVLTGHRGSVWSLAFHPSGTRLASAGNDLLIWQLDGTAPPQTLSGHRAAVMSVAFSPDGATLASGGFDATIQLWRIPDCTIVATLEGHRGAVRALTFSPNGSYLASGGEDQAIRLWRSSDYQPHAMLREPENRVRALAFSPDGGVLASGSHDQNVRLWSLADGQCHSLFQGHINQLRCMALSPDGQTLAVGVAETIYLLDPQSGALRHSLRGHQEWIQALAFSADGTLLASGSDDETIRLWRLPAGTPHATLRGHHGWVQAVAFSPGGRQLFSSSADWSVRCWDVASGACLHTITSHRHHVWTLAVSPDGRWLASGGADGEIQLWDRGAGRVARVLVGQHGAIWSLAFSPNATQLASSGQDGVIQLWDVQQGKCHRQLSGHAQRVVAIALSPDGATLISGSDDRTVRLWDLTSGACLHTMHGHSRAVVAVAFSRDGSEASSGSEDGSVRVWSVVTGHNLRSMPMPRPYDGLKLQGVRGLTAAERQGLVALGAEGG
ncbi:MAG: NACHT domain-containing protein [Candidatus Viridilinea halotolerans]|uniref:NACHT domain-containing protein n=1 Tax=Candidatus Viridilinea halotolerans TaxID=2491704 RepID=A0A426U2P3_9CHLR|nr:MAG: NACHT domain-containing protein [Candidatus Viridilinea halotolerans]